MGDRTVSRRTRHARQLFAGLPSTYDALGAAVSFGQDPRWRRFLVSRLNVGPGSTVLDVATGTAAVAIQTVRRTGSSVVGFDQSEPMLREGMGRAARAGVRPKVRFVIGGAERLPFEDGAFDAVSFAYLLRYVDDVGVALNELARVVRPGGVMAAQEFHVPDNGALRAPWRLYTKYVMPPLGRLVSPEWRDAFKFLSGSIPDFYRRNPLEEQLELWRAAGISDVRAHVMSLGAAVVIWGRKSGSP